MRGSRLPGIGAGLVFQATLDGSIPVTPRQIYMAKVTIAPGKGEYGKSCDGFDYLDGYLDAVGIPHIIASVTPRKGTTFELIENGKQAPAFNLPGDFSRFDSIPKLLLDAGGRRHVVVLYKGGEHHVVRDYLLGSDDEPAVILTAKGPKGTCMGFQAYQGPGGSMAVAIQTTDAGYNDAGDSWISLRTRDQWSPPICVTNNAARRNYVAQSKGAVLEVGNGVHYGPGPGAVAFDKEGRLLLTIVNVETGSFGLSAGGVLYRGGLTASPKLFFYKF